MGITGGMILASKPAMAADSNDNDLNDDNYASVLAMNGCTGPGGCNGMGDKQQDGETAEAELLSQLNEDGKALYDSLDAEGKALALQLANQKCKGYNDCKGLNSCKGDENDCAGQGGCKGQSGCNFKDKNLAVKVAAEKMAEKRANMQNDN